MADRAHAFKDHAHTLRNHARTLRDHARTLADHARTFKDHAHNLHSHVRILHNYARTFKDHARTLADHVLVLRDHVRDQGKQVGKLAGDGDGWQSSTASPYDCVSTRKNLLIVIVSERLLLQKHWATVYWGDGLDAGSE